MPGTGSARRRRMQPARRQRSSPARPPRASRPAPAAEPTHLHTRQQRLQQLIVVRAGGELRHGGARQQAQQATDAAALLGEGRKLVDQPADLQSSRPVKGRGKGVLPKWGLHDRGRHLAGHHNQQVGREGVG